MPPLATLGLVAIVSFASEYVDSSLGMGYGTTLTPVLLLLGLAPLAVVPAVLVAEFVTGLAAALLHHSFGNVRFGRGERASRIALVLGATGAAGAIAAALIAVELPTAVLTLYIGGTILATGAVILATRRRGMRFTWARVSTVAVVAAFNKGIGGGGYGPLVTGGQLLSGLDAKAAIGITSLAEAAVSLVAALVYLVTRRTLDLPLTGVILLGSLASSPLAALTVKKLHLHQMRTVIGVATCVLGAVVLLRFSLP